MKTSLRGTEPFTRQHCSGPRLKRGLTKNIHWHALQESQVTGPLWSAMGGRQQSIHSVRTVQSAVTEGTRGLDVTNKGFLRRKFLTLGHTKLMSIQYQLLRSLPGEPIPSKVTISTRLLVDGLTQFQLLYNFSWSQIKILLDNVEEFGLGQF